mgnify:CR=1 FL=1
MTIEDINQKRKFNITQQDGNEPEDCLENDDRLEIALNVLSNPGPFIIRNLRMMINGVSPYETFLNSPENVRGILLAAAEIIEYYERQKLH